MNELCPDLLRRLSGIVEAKKEGVDKSQLKALLSQTALQLVKLRQAAKQQVDDVERHKADTASSRADVDVSNLQLQNLLYEKNYYTKEIASCRNFRSKFTDEQIELIPIKQFLEDAPQRFKEGVEDKHKLQQQRLEFEKHQRLELLKELEAVKQRKSEHDQLVAGKRKYLEDIQTQLSGIKASASLLRNQLALPADGDSARTAALKASAFLPAPLYVLFHQLLAVRAAFDEDIEVTTTGSEKEAEGWAQASGAEVFERSNLETAQAPKRQKVGPKPQDGDGQYVGHPTTVKLEIRLTGERPLQLQFFYLPRLECVTVKAEDAAQQALLGSLFPEDSGATIPNELPHQQSLSGEFEYDASRADRPYLWAQHLAGLDFLPALTQTGALKPPDRVATIAGQMALYRKQQRVQTILRKLRTAAAAAAHASANLSSLPVAAAESDATKAQAVKRIMTWEEIVKGRDARPQTPLVAAAAASDGPEKAAQAVQSALPDSDEEEGQLPES